MKKSLILCLLLVVISFAGCLIEDPQDEGTGVISVTVNTSANIWGYPEATGATPAYYEFSTAVVGTRTGKWRYTEVGGNGIANLSADMKSLYYPDATWVKTTANSAISASNIGDKQNYVYLYSALSQDSESNVQVYKFGPAANNTVIAGSVAPGTYYVVAFYNYNGGGVSGGSGDVVNLLNRHDRYAFYTDSANAITGNSTPYYDKAVAITVGENQTVSLTIDIDENWVMGKPKAGNGTSDGAADNTITYEFGKYFLKYGTGSTAQDPIPTYD